MHYTIKYNAVNVYQNPVEKALWQFLIKPMSNQDQQLDHQSFTNSLGSPVENSINGYGFDTYRINVPQKFNTIEFNAEFRLYKEIVDPFANLEFMDIEKEQYELSKTDFKIDNERFLVFTKLTQLPANHGLDFAMDTSLSIFDNLLRLNTWIFEKFTFKPKVTDVSTSLDKIIDQKMGVCQDFTHLFCALARANNIPARYVSGYLHQGNGYFGDSQMHAWVECNLPGNGWMGFDPTNNLIAAENHIKVAHGKDYSDCPPIKGLVFSQGEHTTEYTVEVTGQQRRQEHFHEMQQSQQQQ